MKIGKMQEVPDIIKLNVGGTRVMTSKATLTARDTMLSSMFSGRYHIVKDEEGYFFIDADGKHFRKVLNYLRRGDAVLSENHEELLEIKKEAEFYGIQGLVEHCQIVERTIEEKRLREETSRFSSNTCERSMVSTSYLG